MIFNEDCKLTLERIDEPLINLTVTSPPYNVDLGKNYENKQGYDLHDDNMNYQTYLDYLSTRFQLIYNKTVSGGRCCINIGDQKNGNVPLTTDVINFMRKIGWLCYTRIIWNKQQTSSRTAWGSFMSPKQPSFPTPIEYILVFAKDSLNLNRKGITDLLKEEFIDWSLAVWTFGMAKKSVTQHPTSFPDELPKRCIKMFSYIGDVVYDPFAGVGTTLRVGLELKREGFGSEISQNYCEVFNKLQVW